MKRCNKFSVETLLTNALFLVIWAWVLNWLCSKGFKAISWILVLLPFIMALFTYFLTKDVVREGYSGCDNNPGPARDQCLKFEAEGAAIDAANKAKADAAVAKVAAAAAAAAFEAENKRQQEAKKQQQQVLAAMQAASAAAINT